MTALDRPALAAQLAPIREAEYADKVAEVLYDLYACTRVWEAWQYNTMTQDDFTPANEDPDVIENVMAVIRPLLTQVDRLTDALDVAEEAMTLAKSRWVGPNSFPGEIAAGYMHRDLADYDAAKEAMGHE